ncbi:MAG TPA: lyase family protein [Spirochaetia bacterium]|nr:lyase family protein [Spirochaetia bacterium]
METRSIYANLSPLDHRYSLSDPELFERLSSWLSEDAAVRSCIRVELALLKTLLDRLGKKPEVMQQGSLIDAAADAISPAEVYAEEAKTHHNIRALVNVMKRHLPADVRPFVHLGATSADILDTAAALRYRDVVQTTILPLLLDLEEELTRRALEEADTPQIGRTHGQHAVPITFGFAMAEYVSRLGKSIERIAKKAANLRGKLAGAVGAYNATSLIAGDPRELEREFLEALGLLASEHSTQLVEPEYLLELLLELNTAFGIIANLADDLRHLQRSEIAEVREEFTTTQVGSSTMPQKRNPWNSEHVKSLWKEFCPRVLTFFMDQISEHQRDLTSSASSRFIAEYMAGLALAAGRMRSVVRSLAVDRKRMAQNLASEGELIFSEPIYILLALGGDPDAHEAVRKATLQAGKSHERLTDVLRQDGEAWGKLARQLSLARGVDPATFFADPANYSGIAAKQARALAGKYSDACARLRKELAGRWTRS